MKDIEILQTKIEDMGFPRTTYNCLRRAGCETLGDILEQGEENLMKIRELDKKRVDEIASKIESYGFELELSFNGVKKRLQEPNWQEYLRSLPARCYFQDDFIILCQAMSVVLKDKMANAFFSLQRRPQDFETLQQGIASDMDTFKDIVKEKQEIRKKNEDLAGKLAHIMLEKEKQ